MQDGSSGRLVELKEKVSEEPKTIDPQKSVVHEPVVDVPLPPRRSSRIFWPPERYMDMLMEEMKEIFLIGDKGHGDDPNTFDEVMSDIYFKK